MTKGRYINLQPTPENFRALWDKLHTLDDNLTGAQTTLTTQDQTLKTLSTTLTSVKSTAQTALVKATTALATPAAGTGTGTTPPTPPPGAPPQPTPPPPPPGPLPPPPVSGPPVSGTILSTDMLNLATVTIESSPADIATWPITTTISPFTFSAALLDAEFSKKSGVGRWPDYTPPGWTGPIQFTLWLFLFIGGVWYGAGALLIWFGETVTGIQPSGIGTNPTWWLYAPALWGPMVGHQPAVGENVGFMVSAGDARTVGGVTSVKERSQVIVVPFPDNNGGTWT